MFIERWGEGREHYFGIHGWSGDHRTFQPLAKQLPSGATLFSVDLPGCGRSAAPVRWSLESVVDELVSGVRAPVTLIGNCSGAIFTLLLAQRIPERIERVVLIDAFASWPWYFRVFTSENIGRYAYFSTFANPVGRWLTNLSLAGKRGSDTHLTRGFAQTDHEITYRYLAMLKQAGSAQRFADLKMPVDIIYGERSFNAVRESVEVWRQMWPHARTWRLPKAGHLPILEATGALHEILFQETACPTAP
ncbi:MAG: alpha/beta hydrolase [Acidobacteriota bacterium]|nr:alpha/beta hydrolase [Acidobacteriota bacterium]